MEGRETAPSRWKPTHMRPETRFTTTPLDAADEPAGDSDATTGSPEPESTDSEGYSDACPSRFSGGRMLRALLVCVTTLATFVLFMGNAMAKGNESSTTCGTPGQRACCAAENSDLLAGGCYSKTAVVDPGKKDESTCPGFLGAKTYVWCMAKPVPPPVTAPVTSVTSALEAALPDTRKGSEADQRCGSPGLRACCALENADLRQGGCYNTTAVVDPGKHDEVSCPNSDVKTTEWCMKTPPARVDTAQCFGQMTPGFDGGCYSEFYWKNPNGTAPPHYTHCGGGLARDTKTCAKVTALMTYSVGNMVASFVTLGASNAGDKSVKATKKTAEATAAAKLLAPRVQKAFPALQSTGKIGSTKIAQLFTKPGAITKLKAAVGRETLTKLKVIVGITRFTVADLGGRKFINPIHMIRAGSEVASLGDPTGILGVVAAFLWPTYGVGDFPQPGYTPTNPAPPEPVE